jgi:alpha-D-ribose 1-methylphosphonate 5-triphosphate synthase subunit PhnG
MLIVSQHLPAVSTKSSHCHEMFMALPYQVVYYHRQLESGKVKLKPNMSAGREIDRTEEGRRVRRKAAMSVLAQASAAEIVSCLDSFVLPAHEDLREAESGLVMVRGRIGGDGAPFNLGEATVSRAAVRLSSGEVGFGYTLGRDRDKARIVALCDALVQSEAFADVVEAKVVAPLRAALVSRRDQKAAETAATRVDFYTMVRGE